MRLVATTGVGMLALTACGGGVELTQPQTAEALLSAEEFPLDGFTRGKVEEKEPSSEDDASQSTEAADDSLAALLEGQDVPEECREALEATDLGEDNFTAQSSVEFTQGDESAPLQTSIELIVATVDGDSPLEPMSTVNDTCEELTIEEDGISMVLSFDDLDELDGTKMSIALGELNVDMLMGGRTEDAMVVAGFATGVEEADLTKVIEAQIAKLDDVED